MISAKQWKSGCILLLIVAWFILYSFDTYFHRYPICLTSNYNLYSSYSCFTKGNIGVPLPELVGGGCHDAVDGATPMHTIWIYLGCILV